MRDLPGVNRAARSAIAALSFTFISLLCVPLFAGQSGQPTASAEQGRRLFTGQAFMQNGGPPCGSCHAISSLEFPGGGTIAPDLSAAYQTLGDEGMDVTLQTLYFPTMMPLYQGRPLTAQEQQALKMFLQQAATSPAAQPTTLLLAALAAAGFVVLMAITWLAWRNRLQGVRAPLVKGS